MTITWTKICFFFGNVKIYRWFVYLSHRNTLECPQNACITITITVVVFFFFLNSTTWRSIKTIYIFLYLYEEKLLFYFYFSLRDKKRPPQRVKKRRGQPSGLNWIFFWPVPKRWSAMFEFSSSSCSFSSCANTCSVTAEKGSGETGIKYTCIEGRRRSFASPYSPLSLFLATVAMNRAREEPETRDRIIDHPLGWHSIAWIVYHSRPYYLCVRFPLRPHLSAAPSSSARQNRRPVNLLPPILRTLCAVYIHTHIHILPLLRKQNIRGNWIASFFDRSFFLFLYKFSKSN